MNRKAAAILEALESLQSGTVAEVGAIRFKEEVATDGFSTVYICRHCVSKGLTFVSFEKEIETAHLANAVLASHALPPSVICADGAAVLGTVDEVAFLYLDGSNDPREAFDQFRATRFATDAILIVDDCQESEGYPAGKGTVIAEWLTRNATDFQLVDTEPGFKLLVARLNGMSIREPQSRLRVNVITNLNNAAGLEREANLLKRAFERNHCDVTLIHMGSPDNAPFADINVFDEIVIESMFYKATSNWVLPHPEWWCWDESLWKIDVILAKTLDCLRCFRQQSQSVVYLGFMSEDHFDPTVVRERVFLHVRGQSALKNTDAVIDTWRQYAPQAELLIVGPCFAEKIDNVTVVGRLSDAELRRAQNRHAFHLCPSEYEGWGHTIHEGLGVGAVIVTTAAPPMSEFGIVERFLVPITDQYQLRKAVANKVSAAGIYEAVQRCVALSPEELAECSRASRQLFEADTIAFEARFTAMVDVERSRIHSKSSIAKRFPIDLCIVTAPRPEPYLSATISSLRLSDKEVDWPSVVRLQVGTDDPKFPNLSWSNVTRSRLTKEECASQSEWQRYRRLTYNLWRALNESPADNWGTCICEDDLMFRIGFPDMLMQTLEEIRMAERPKFVLAVYSHFSNEDNPSLARGRFYCGYDARAHYGNCCIFISDAVRGEVTQYLWDHGVQANGAPADILIGEFCHDLKARGDGEMFQSVVSLAQHVGFVSGGTSAQYSASPTFSKAWPEG